MLVIDPVSAILMLDDIVKLEPGDAVAFNAANSGIGRWIAAVAKERGIITIGLVRSESATTACDYTIHDGQDIDAVSKQLPDLNVAWPWTASVIRR